MNFSIRRGQLEDAQAIFELARQFNTGREQITRDEFEVALDNVLRKREQETNVLFVSVDAANVVTGYSLMTVSRLLHAPGLTAHLQEIVVDEARRGEGFGDRLMEANERYCQGRGVRQFSASTARIGTFYNHRGFRSVGEHYRRVLDMS